MLKKISRQILLFLIAIGLSFTINSFVSHSQTIPNKLIDLGAIAYNDRKIADIDSENLSNLIYGVEGKWEDQYEAYFQEDFESLSMKPRQISQKLLEISEETGKRTAVLWLLPQPEALNAFLITPGKEPIGKQIREANERSLAIVTQEFVEKVSNLANNYLPSSQLLYKWLITPIEPDLQAEKIDTLITCLGVGLRTLPLAALHDGEHFLIEKYNLTRIPGFNLSPITYTNLSDAKVLAMGATEFKNQAPLPGVEVELSAIGPNPWQGVTILNQDFTVANLQAQRQQESFEIIHLATHADFVPGIPRNSYIQFFDRKVTLDRLNRLQLNDPPVELLVLSACQTAVGDRDAEMGFAGLALQSGVKSVLASLWYVSDAGTLALMSEFYQQLKTIPFKADALRQTQLALLQGRVYLQQGELVNSRGEIALPSVLANTKENNLSHPFYWASFSLIGSPW
ncbi:MAG: CHAT domain-containing protein [Hydrococcus sp. CRU_1_1]|nr:CHAT domain-containing protein [Hydrococcus sp. CRU_1_1]